jgi:tryptophan-rich hypothetical protein
VTPINPKKLLNSKWTAVNPVKREKHFIITGVDRDETERVTSCTMEAVHSQREFKINWRDLRDPAIWKAGWQS